MRVAIAGKGGSGKTTIAGTLARLLARAGRQVTAIDGDTNPNLSQALGIEAGVAAELAALPGDLLVRRDDGGSSRVELALPAGEVLRRHAHAAPDGVRLVVMGRIDHAGAG